MNKTFPKEVNEMNEKHTVYSVEVSPVTHDIPDPKGWGTWFRGEWYPMPAIDTLPGLLGVPKAETGLREKEDLYRLDGAKAFVALYKANNNNTMVYDTRIIEHKIEVNYVDTEIRVYEEE